jgi:predicted cobalt transporter CbtA
MTDDICSLSPVIETDGLLMVRTLLIRGMLVGIVSGLLAFGFGKVFGEPQVDRAVAFETAMDAAKAVADAAKGIPAAPPEPELVSRSVQAGIGLFTGVMVYGTALGGLFALVFAFAYGRVGELSPRAVSALLATAGFLAVYIVPNLKYPANPPSVGEAETIGMRTGLYFLMMMISIAAMVLAIMAQRRLTSRYDAWTATLIAAAGFVIAVAIAQSVLPAVDEVPEGFPAVLLWKFRMASLGMQIVLWTSLGLVFGWLTERAFAGSHRFPGGRRVHAIGRSRTV